MTDPEKPQPTETSPVIPAHSTDQSVDQSTIHDADAAALAEPLDEKVQRVVTEQLSTMPEDVRAIGMERFLFAIFGRKASEGEFKDVSKLLSKDPRLQSMERDGKPGLLYKVVSVTPVEDSPRGRKAPTGEQRASLEQMLKGMRGETDHLPRGKRSRRRK